MILELEIPIQLNKLYPLVCISKQGAFLNNSQM